MSRGLGKTQRAILRLIAQAKPSDRWLIEELSASIYGDSTPTRAQIGSIKRALKRMQLPGSWRAARVWPGRSWWLYNRNAVAGIAQIELVELELVEIEVSSPPRAG